MAIQQQPQMTPQQYQQLLAFLARNPQYANDPSFQRLLNQPSGRDPRRKLTFEEWLRETGRQRQQPQQQAQQGPNDVQKYGKRAMDIIDILERIEKNYGAKPTEFSPTNSSTTQGRAPGSSIDTPDVPYSQAPEVRVPKTIPRGSTVPEGYTEVGTAGDGGVAIVPNENIQADGTVDVGNLAQGAAGALQLYGAYKRYQGGDKVGAGLSAAQGGANLAAAAGSATAASVAPYAGLVMGAYNTHNAAQDGSLTRNQKGSEVMKQVGLTAADYFTFGLSSLADGLIRSTGTGAKWGKKIDDLTSKTFGAKAIGSVLGGLDTKHTQLKNTKDLFKEAEKLKETNPGYAAYLQGARRETIEKPKAHKEGKYFAGKYKNFDEYKKAGLQAADLTHVLGNLQTFGPEWANLSEEQRQAVTQGIIDNDLYISDKGEVNIRKENRERAKQIYDEVAASGFAKKPMVASQEEKPMEQDLRRQGFQIPRAAGDGNRMLIQQQVAEKFPGVLLNGQRGLPVGFDNNFGGGYWVDREGNRVEGIDPGFNVGNRFVPNDPKRYEEWQNSRQKPTLEDRKVARMPDKPAAPAAPAKPSIIPEGWNPPSGGGTGDELSNLPGTLSPEFMNSELGRKLAEALASKGPTMPVVAPAVPPRSQTLSPGIGLDGKPFDYSKVKKK